VFFYFVNMPTFKSVLENIQTTLREDSALIAFCTSKWNKSLKVESVYAERTEIQLSDLPIVLITRPSVEKVFKTRVRDSVHTVRLYCGFQQKDKLEAMSDLIELEELIDDALLKDHTRGGNAMDTNPGESINDEGKYHPVYFLAMNITVNHRR